MNRRSAVVSGVACALSYGPFAHAAPPVIAQTEINYLLGFIEQSGCIFYRNGSWYDARQAQAHLRSKYDALAARDQIDTAEDFIEKAATRSSLSGRPYEVKCGGSEAVPSNRWLREELRRYRTTGSHEAESAPRGMRGAPGESMYWLGPEAQSSFLILS